jgi:hypothetical protein
VPVDDIIDVGVVTDINADLLPLPKAQDRTGHHAVVREGFDPFRVRVLDAAAQSEESSPRQLRFACTPHRSLSRVPSRLRRLRLKSRDDPASRSSESSKRYATACSLFIPILSYFLARSGQVDRLNGRQLSHNYSVSYDDLYDSHHALVFVVDGVAVIDEAPDDLGVGKGDHNLDLARPGIGCGRHREGVTQASSSRFTPLTSVTMNAVWWMWKL